MCATPTETNCTTPAAKDYFDSLLALDLTTGRLMWSLRTLHGDAATIPCRNTPTCGPDYNFFAAPNLFTATIGGRTRSLVGAARRAVYTGWRTPRPVRSFGRRRSAPVARPGVSSGATATDVTRIYASVTISSHAQYTLQPSGVLTTGGAVSALDPATGAILRQTPDPQEVGDFGFVSSANGVVCVGSGAGSGNNMYALDAASGTIRWTYAGSGSVMGGAAVVHGVVYWATGSETKYRPSSDPGCGHSYLHQRGRFSRPVERAPAKIVCGRVYPDSRTS